VRRTEDDRLVELPGTLCSPFRKLMMRICRPFMELAGLEPATSWGGIQPHPHTEKRLACSTFRTSAWNPATSTACTAPCSFADADSTGGAKSALRPEHSMVRRCSTARPECGRRGQAESAVAIPVHGAAGRLANGLANGAERPCKSVVSAWSRKRFRALGPTRVQVPPPPYTTGEPCFPRAPPSSGFFLAGVAQTR
jgi:hypothetical protein